jgi:hypothetical protein
LGVFSFNAYLSVVLDWAVSGLKVQNHQQSTYANKLSNQHPEFDNFRIVKFFVQSFKESVVDRMMIERKFFCILYSEFLPGRVVVALCIQLGNFFFT